MGVPRAHPLICVPRPFSLCSLSVLSSTSLSLIAPSRLSLSQPLRGLFSSTNNNINISINTLVSLESKKNIPNPSLSLVLHCSPKFSGEFSPPPAKEPHGGKLPQFSSEHRPFRGNFRPIHDELAGVQVSSDLRDFQGVFRPNHKDLDVV